MMTVGKNSQSLRQENLRLLLQNILSSGEALSRATLAKQVGLARPTVSRLVDELVDLGIVSELAPVRNTVGRPAAPLVARAGVRCSVGVEVNLNYLAVVVLDLAGAELFKVCDSFTSRTASPKQVIARAFTLLRDFLPPAGMQVVSIWLAVPGLASLDRKTVVTSPNLGGENVTPSDFVEDLIPVRQGRHWRRNCARGKNFWRPAWMGRGNRAHLCRLGRAGLPLRFQRMLGTVRGPRSDGPPGGIERGRLN